jgi:hypothetical protein
MIEMAIPQVAEPIEGSSIRMGGRSWIVPPLNFKAVKRLRPKLLKLNLDSFNEESLEAVTEVVHAALVRNYPDVTLDQVEEWVDLRNAPVVIEAVLNVSGLVPKAEGATAMGAAPVAP